MGAHALHVHHARRQRSVPAKRVRRELIAIVRGAALPGTVQNVPVKMVLRKNAPRDAQ